MVWSIRMPVIFSTVFWVQAGLPWSVSPTEKAALNFVAGCSLVHFPFGSLHEGIVTSESRGMEMPTACLWSAYTCSRIVVSERAPASSPPPRSALLPPRLSEPMSSTLTGLLPFASACVSGGRSVLTASGSKVLMLPLSFR